MFGPWKDFSSTQFKNMMIYIVGIMFYKFALEWYNGAVITLANERFVGARYSSIGILTGLYYAAQCVGSIIVAPLIRKYQTRSVLSVAVLIFGLMSAILLIVDASTGGTLRFKTVNKQTAYGKWNLNGLFPIYIISGVSYGTVELIRRVIPKDIVGGDIQLLRRMDATVHILYEFAGTVGAITSTFLIAKFGYNYSFFLSPVLFAFASITWRWVDAVDPPPEPISLEDFEREKNKGYIGSVLSGFSAFFIATYHGAFLVFSHRRFVWLLSGYALALYGHRFLENTLAPIYAKQVLGDSSWSQIIVGGSNIGELLGAATVLVTTNFVTTPLPWLRLDALALNIVWVLPFIKVQRLKVKEAWRIAAIFLPVSFGWAAGDVSLAAYIQATLAKIEYKDRRVSSLGAVMAFLYVFYLVVYAVLDTVLGEWVDTRLGGIRPGTELTAEALAAETMTEVLTAEELAKRARDALKFVGGVHFSVLCVIIIASTFIPKGSFAFNPKGDFNGDNSDADSVNSMSSDEDQVEGHPVKSG